MASNMESEMDEVGKVNNALPDNLDDLFSIDDNEEDEDYEEAEEDPFDLLNNISENNALTESPFRLKAPSKASKKAQSESPDKGGFSFGSSVPQFEQSSFGALSSVLGKSKKKKQPTSQFIPVNLNNKKLLKKNVTDHFSLSHALDALTVDSKQYVNSLSLSGVEQVTDMFFLMIKIQRVPLHRLTSFSLTGNAFVSDEGINWLLKTSGFKAQEISFKGCINLTHKSLYAILNMAIKPTKIDLSFTGVSTVQTMPSTMTSLTLDCCPLISPPAAMMNTRELRDVMSDKTLIPFETYKMLVLHDPSDANGTGLFVKKTLDKSHPICVEKAWHPESSNSPQYNVYECLTGSGCENWVLSNGGIVLLPFSNTDDSTAKKITTQILSIIGQHQDNLFVLVGLSGVKKDSLKIMLDKVNGIIRLIADPLIRAIPYKDPQDQPLLNEHKFDDQTQTVLSHRLFNNLDLILMIKELLTAVSLAGDPKHSFLKSTVKTMKKVFPWNNLGFFPETLKTFEAITVKPQPITPLSDITKSCPPNLLKELDPQSGCREIGKALEILHDRGSCLYFPGVDKKPALCDLGSLSSLLSLRGQASQREDIPGLGKDIPCWRMDDFKILFKGKQGQINLFFDVLTEQGLVFRFPCSPKDPKVTDTLVYVMSHDLPGIPDIPVDEIWPADQPDGDLQRDTYYTFPSLPQWLFPCFLRKLQETSKVVLMWKSGLVLRQGPVMVLVELLANQINHDLPTIVISARVQMAAMSDTLYVTFTNVKTILSGLLNSRNVYAMKTICCKVCNPTSNRRYALSAEHNCCHITDIKFKHLANKDLVMCKKQSGKVLMTKEEFIGPDFIPHQNIPNHEDPDIVVNETASKNMDQSLRCHLCNNCGENGMACHGNLRQGITAKHCSCKHELKLCSYCGVCSHCTQTLAEAYAAVHPSFRLGNAIGTTMGSMMAETEFGKYSKYTFGNRMSLSYFSHLSMFMLSEVCNFSIHVMSPSSRIDYKTALGSIVVNGQEKVLENAKCKIGDHVELKILHQQVDGSLKEVLEIRKNDVTLLSIPSAHFEAKIDCQSKDNSKMLVFTHKLMAMDVFYRLNMGQNPIENGNYEKPLSCCGPFPSVTERRMSREYKGFELFLVDQLKNIFYSLAGVLLPQVVTTNNILYPSSEVLRGQQVYHPVCTMNICRLDDSKDPHSFCLLHLVNGKSMTIQEQVIKALQTVILGIHIIIIHSQLELPQFDQLFPELKSAVSDKICTTIEVQTGVQELMRIAALNMAFTLSDSFSLETFRKQDIFNTTSTYVGVITKSIIKKMRENPQELGLEHLGMLDPESSAFNFSDGFVCPGHSVCWKADEKITNVTPDWFKGYSKFITTFNLGDNQLTFLPPEVFQELSQLRVLDLHSNYLEALPDTISCCKNLEELILRGNNLLDLPATLDGCQALKSLDISSNRIDELPGVITRLYSLTHLVAQELLLTVLPDNIGNLSKLTVLNLNENCLTGLPESFSMLQNLKELYLAGIAWLPNKANNFLSKDNFKKALGPVVTRWLEGSQDKSMSLDDMFNNFDVDGQGTLNTTNIARANAILFNTFPRFGYTGKTLPDDKTPSGFPEEILALKNLSTLDLQYQGLVHIPKDIQDLQNLTTLQLGSNPYLLSVAAEAGRCPLQHLNLSECPLLKTPPKEIRERGFTTTVAYLKRLLTGSVDCKRTKLMLVGLGGAGKTSLVRALMSSLQQKSTLTGADAITDGIDICTWDVNHKGETVSYSVWDFAGQTIYYNTHQFFLSDRAVYLLLWNIRLGHEHAGLNFWLNSITVHAPKAPIFVVGTHTDQMTKISLPMEDLKEKYHQIMDFHFVSSKNGNGIPELKEALFDVTLQQEYMGEKIPQAWLQLESNITRQRAEKSVNVMQYKDVEAEALNVGIIDKTEVVQAVQFLHDLGMVQHFQNEYLKDRVVINPQWIVDVMACVVSVKQTVVKDGRLMHSDINEVWKEYVDMADWLLKVTEEFDLTYPLEGENCNIVPCLLPETQPDFEWPDVVKRKKEKKSRQKILETKLVYTFDYLPAGLFNRGQVRLYGISDPDILIWKTGIFLKKNGQIALVQQIGYSELNVKVQGPQPDNLLFLIYEVFECLIKESFQGVTYDCEIPCPDCVKQDSVYPHMFPASVVRRAVEVKAPFIQCHKNFHSSPVLNLQGVLAPDDNADYDIHLSQDVNSLHQMQEAMTVDIFISYCSKDAPKNKSSVIHPATVCADLEQEGYTCFLPKDEQLDSREEMAKKLVHSSVILVFASNNYAANDICCDMYKYAINTLKKPAIVVAVGEDFGWKQSASLGVFMTDVVFVNMINSKKDVYKVKFAELLSTLQKNEQLSQTRMETSNSCFISYAWANSETAVALGTKALPGSVGKSDPREFKTFLESRGIGCWLDIEQVNVNDQLFARIAKGLCESRVMVACVSDEYANSRNCIREIKFAIQINLPIIIAVVGTGVRWLKTEVGLLTTDFPKVNFQHNPDKETLQTLYQLILDNMKPETEEDTDTKENKEEMEENNQISFQEMYELAQRKLLRQVSSYPSTYDIGNYPRLFVMDIAETVSEDEVKLVNYQVHTLCECDQGWHSVSDPIVMETKKVDADMVAEVLDEFTPYLYRINTVMEHNTGFVLNLFAIGTGQQCNQQIKELAMVSPLSVPASYHRLRVQIHELDTKKTKGNLKRCRLSSGRIIWLCEEHAVQMKVTVLSEEAGEVKHIITNQPWLDTMTEYIKNMRSTKYRPYVFKSNSKTKRYIEDFIEDDTDIKRALKKTVLRRQSSIKILDVTADMSETKPQDHVSTEEATSIESKKKKKKKKHKETPEEEEQVSEGLSSQTDPGVKLADPELKHTEPEFKHADPEVKQAESEVKQADSEVKQADLEVKQADPEVKQPDPEVKQDDFEVKRSTISLKGRTTSANSQPGNRSAPPGPDDGNSAWPSQSRVQENKGEDDRKTQAGAKSKACVLL